ncbi:MAG: radical SAM protein [Proteobacteria bacterium]|nr:radical SAM protein [Pseudomonadota bacterium]MBU1737998.1 radical SAM protein [Pseudomonadota bacterium]
MRPPLIIPFFIAHQGCPHRCVFCNQRKIAGAGDVAVSGSAVATEIKRRLQQPRHPGRGKVVVAFYGGSFTGLTEKRQRELLDAVSPFLENGEVSGIRLSTRPDAMDSCIAAFLKARGVCTVELGVQSMDDRVLAESGRGHTGADSEKAIRCVREAGLEVGVQLMAGLPGQTTSGALRSAERISFLAPDLVRIYPAVVLKDSELAERYRSAAYRPLSLARAVILCGRMQEIFRHRGVRVVRTGLQATDTLAGEILAGPYHPAFGELVQSRNLYRRVVKLLQDPLRPTTGKMIVAEADQSVFRGEGNSNLKRLADKGLLDGVEPVFEKNAIRGEVTFVGG